jgi:predicted RNase H-like HicB family nuclease
MRQVIIYPDKDGNGYVADCPSLPGCHSQGETQEETIANSKEAIDLWIEDALEHGEEIPDDSRMIQIVLV